MPSHFKKVTVAAAILSISALSFAYADSATTTTQPGSVDDPVITKSYFDQNIQKKVADELAKQTVNEEMVKQLVAAELAKAGNNGATSSPSTTPTVSPSASNSKYAIIKLEAGQTLYGGESSEIIVRTGKTVVFSSDDSGIADVTAGKDITAGSTVELNHLLIVPREGRGIKPAPKNNQEIFVMIRGSYLLTNADGTKVSP